MVCKTIFALRRPAAHFYSARLSGSKVLLNALQYIPRGMKLRRRMISLNSTCFHCLPYSWFTSSSRYSVCSLRNAFLHYFLVFLEKTVTWYDMEALKCMNCYLNHTSYHSKSFLFSPSLYYHPYRCLTPKPKNLDHLRCSAKCGIRCK